MAIGKLVCNGCGIALQFSWMECDKDGKTVRWCSRHCFEKIFGLPCVMGLDFDDDEDPGEL